MEKYSLTAKPRDGAGKGAARRLRREGLVPAVLYGDERDSRLLAIEERQLQALFRSAGRGSHLVDLKIEGESGKPSLVLLKEVQQHPARGSLLHLDLQHVSMTKEIHLTVPVILTGEPVGVKTAGGVLELLSRELDIQCLPDNVPHEIKVDVSGLDVGDSLHVSDLGIEGVTILASDETAVVTVARPTVVVEEKPEVEEAVEEAAEGEEAPKEEEAPTAEEKTSESKE